MMVAVVDNNRVLGDGIADTIPKKIEYTLCCFH